MQKLFKRLFKSEWFRSFIAWVVASYIRLVYYTSRVRFDFPEASRPYMDGTLPALFAFWHGRLLLMPMICPPKRRMHVMISIHRDGEMIARTMHRFNFGTVRGSTSRGGISAAMNSVKCLQEGDNVSVTPDGPRGPAMKVQPGIIAIAHMANVPILAVTYSSTFHRRMKSWDRFMVALPFGRVHYKLGVPLINVSAEQLEAEMVRLTEEVDAMS